MRREEKEISMSTLTEGVTWILGLLGVCNGRREMVLSSSSSSPSSIGSTKSSISMGLSRRDSRQ